MAHLHALTDNDGHFVIIPRTRQIKNRSGKKKLMKGDHKSEIFSFDIPRFIEGHDMSLCNVVEIHYNNISADGTEKYPNMAEGFALNVSPDDENKVVFSWEITNNATRVAGILSFFIRFACIADDGTIELDWYTDTYDEIAVGDVNTNSQVVVEFYADIIHQWKVDIVNAAVAGSAEAQAKAEEAQAKAEQAKEAAETAQTATEQAATEAAESAENAEESKSWAKNYAEIATKRCDEALAYSQQSAKFVDTATAAASRAAQSEQNASASEQNAANFAADAEQSAKEAKESAGNAATSEANAKTSEQNASASEQSANESAQDAATSEANAKAYAATAAQLQRDVSVLSGAASKCATRAETAEKNAATSAEEAAASAEEAKAAAASAGGQGGGQADWNAAEGEAGYVANRTHWKESTEAWYLEDTALTIASDGSAALPNQLGLEAGCEYYVKWNDETYLCKAEVYDEGSGALGVLIGNHGMVTGGTSTGEPFVLVDFNEEGMALGGVPGMVVVLDGSQEVTISIRGEATVWYPLEEGFLPDSVRTMYVIVKQDSNQKYRCGSTNAQIYEAYQNGKSIRCLYYRDNLALELPAIDVTENTALFAAIASQNSMTVLLSEDSVSVIDENLAYLSEVPKRTSQLENDVGYLTSSAVKSYISQAMEAMFDGELYAIDSYNGSLGKASNIGMTVEHYDAILSKIDAGGIPLVSIRDTFDEDGIFGELGIALNVNRANSSMIRITYLLEGSIYTAYMKKSDDAVSCASLYKYNFTMSIVT